MKTNNTQKELKRIQKQKIYYAHSMLIHGSVREMNEHAFIYDAFNTQRLINPAHENGRNMRGYLSLVETADVIVASEYEGYVGKGVLSEILHGLSLDKKVVVLRKSENEYELLPIAGFLFEDANDWKIRHAKIITK